MKAHNTAHAHTSQSSVFPMTETVTQVLARRNVEIHLVQ